MAHRRRRGLAALPGDAALALLHKQCAGALARLHEMIIKELLQDAVSFNATTSASEKGKQCDPALALLQEVIRKELISDTVSFNATISARE